MRKSSPIRILSLLCVLFFCASSAWAALAIDNTTVLDQDSSADPWTFTHTTNAGANLLVVACDTSNVADNFNAVTYNGDAMTELIEAESNNAAAIYYLVNPDIGVGLTVSVDLSPSIDNGGCYAISFSGAETTTPLTAQTSDGGTSTNGSSLSISCAVGGIMVSVGGLATVRVVTTTAGTQIMNQDDGTASNFGARVVGAGASTTISYTWDGVATNFMHVVACVNAAASQRRAPVMFQ